MLFWLSKNISKKESFTIIIKIAYSIYDTGYQSLSTIRATVSRTAALVAGAFFRRTEHWLSLASSLRRPVVSMTALKKYGLKLSSKEK